MSDGPTEAEVEAAARALHNDFHAGKDCPNGWGDEAFGQFARAALTAAYALHQSALEDQRHDPRGTPDDLAIAEVRQALADATPGPWTLNQPDYSVNVVGLDGYTLARALSVEGKNRAHADARLIANAPTWLADLCDEVERLREALKAERLRNPLNMRAIEDPAFVMEWDEMDAEEAALPDG